MDVPGAAFDIVLAMPSPRGLEYDLGKSPDALRLHLIGGELALSFDAEEKILKALASLQQPVCAVHAESNDRKSRKPVSVYILPKME
jgi:hypothetical protein